MVDLRTLERDAGLEPETLELLRMPAGRWAVFVRTVGSSSSITSGPTELAALLNARTVIEEFARADPLPETITSRAQHLAVFEPWWRRGPTRRRLARAGRARGPARARAVRQ